MNPRIRIDLSKHPYYAERFGGQPHWNGGKLFFEILIFNSNTGTMRGRLFEDETANKPMYSNMELGVSYLVDNHVTFQLDDEVPPYKVETLFVIKVGEQFVRFDVTTSGVTAPAFGDLLEAKVWQKRGMAENWAENDNYNVLKGERWEVVSVKRHTYLSEK